ncbi:phasin family protein [Sessilibacter sp. MAH2]
MFDKIVEQAQTASKPFSEMMTINAEVLEKFAEKQTSLLTGVMNDSIEYAKDLASQKDLAGIYETQKSYAEGLQEKMMTSAKETYALMTDTSEKMSELFNGAFSEIKKFEAAVTTPQAAKSAPRAKAPAKAKAPAPKDEEAAS